MMWIRPWPLAIYGRPNTLIFEGYSPSREHRSGLSAPGLDRAL